MRNTLEKFTMTFFVSMPIILHGTSQILTLPPKWGSLHATRNVAEPYREPLKKALEDLVDQDIIEPVMGASEWLHPIVVVPKKDGGIRMCVDLTWT